MRGASRMPYEYSEAYGTHATQSPASVTTRAPAASSASTSRHSGHGTGGAGDLAGRRGRDERVGVDLPVRMIDGGAHLAAPVLEHEHVLDLRAGEESFRAARPEVDDPPQLVGRQRGERLVVLG